MPKPSTSRAEYYSGALAEGYDGDLPKPQSREDYYMLKPIDQMNKISGQTVFTPRGTVQEGNWFERRRYSRKGTRLRWQRVSCYD